MGVGGLYSKKRWSGNAREKLHISIILYGYGDKKIFRLCWSEKNAYKIGLIPIISWYAHKVLFSGVFGTLTY